MIWALLFLAGLISEALVTAQTLAIQKRKAAGAAVLAFLGWGLWGLALGELVINRANVIPFALGAAIGTLVVVWRRKE
ncbi:MAG: hypothetical protein WC935_00190 [Thermoleophilia bacterium]